MQGAGARRLWWYWDICSPGMCRSNHDDAITLHKLACAAFLSLQNIQLTLYFIKC